MTPQNWQAKLNVTFFIRLDLQYSLDFDKKLSDIKRRENVSVVTEPRSIRHFPIAADFLSRSRIKDSNDF